MKSFPEIPGRYVRLRPLAAGDAEFLFNLRNDPILTQFLNDGPATLADQRNWMDAYFRRDNDYNFVVVSRDSQAPIGTVALIDIDLMQKRAEPGRWLIRGDSASAVEADLLSNSYAFETLGLETRYFSIFTPNAQVISYHTKCGARRTATVADHFHKRGMPYAAYFYELSRSAFLTIKRPLLEKLLYRGTTPP
jgi:RimJ/RimL family protein N-acetyltransferase